MVSPDQQHQIGFDLQENDIKQGKTTFQKILSVAAVGEVVRWRYSSLEAVEGTELCFWISPWLPSIKIMRGEK